MVAPRFEASLARVRNASAIFVPRGMPDLVSSLVWARDGDIQGHPPTSEIMSDEMTSGAKKEYLRINNDSLSSKTYALIHQDG
jgi:hypothetical protein